MKRSRFAEEQIIGILKENETGVPAAELCRKHGMSDASFYNWKAKYAGLEVSEAKRMRGLETENARLKKLLADAMLDNAALKDLLGKNGRARRVPGGLPACSGSLRDERAAGLPTDRCRQNERALPLDPRSGCAPARPAESAGAGAKTVRLPPASRSASA